MKRLTTKDKYIAFTSIFNFHVSFLILYEEFYYQVIYLADRGERAVCEFAAAGLLGLRIRIPPETWMSVCFECCVLSGRSP
jgi:hypothetical protein